MATTLCYNCPLCCVSSPTLKLYVSHLRVTHSKEKSFSVLCGVNDCREVFRTFSAFNSHIYRHHRVEIGIQNQSADNNLTVDTDVVHGPSSDLTVYQDGGAQSAEGGSGSDGQDTHMDYDFASGSNFTILQDPTVTNLAAAKMLLQLREGHQVSQVALTEVVSGCRLLCNQALIQLRADVTAALSSPEEGVIAHLNLKEDYDPFKNIDTNYLFEKYCVEHLGCLVSIL